MSKPKGAAAPFAADAELTVAEKQAFPSPSGREPADGDFDTASQLPFSANAETAPVDSERRRGLPAERSDASVASAEAVVTAITQIASSGPGSGDTRTSDSPSGTKDTAWSMLDAIEVKPDAATPGDTGQSLTNIHLMTPGHERVSVRLIESPGGMEVRVSTDDQHARHRLLGGLDELAGRVRELSLGALIESPGSAAPDSDLAGGRRQQQEREARRPKARRSGAATAVAAFGTLPPPTNSSQDPN